MKLLVSLLTLSLAAGTAWFHQPAPAGGAQPSPAAFPVALTSGGAVAPAVAFPAAVHDELGSGADDGQVPAAAADGRALVTLGGALSHGALLADAPGELFLHLTLQADDPPGLTRPSMNLALVIDRSGSMASEQKLEHAKSAADQLVARLRPDDRLAVVAYDDAVDIAVPSRPAGERERFHDAIARLAPGGSTNLHGGMLAGYEEVLQHFDPAAANRVLLISDGLANAGISDAGAIRERAGACRARGVRIATLGVGLSYDEDLMLGIADAAGGAYQYVADPEGLADYLAREIDDLGRVVAKDVRVALRLAEGVTLDAVYGYGHVQAADTVEVAVPDLLAGERRKLVVRLTVAPGAAVAREVLWADLRCTDASGRDVQRTALPPLSVLGTELAAVVRDGRNLPVLAQSEVVRNATTIDRALRLQKQGEVDDARQLLLARHDASRTLNAEYHDAELDRILGRMRTLAAELEHTRHDAPAARDLQLLEQMRALGYLGR